MLYLEIETEALHFIALHGNELQEATYHMQPALNFSRNLRQALAMIPSSASSEKAVRVLVSNPGTAMPLNEFSEEVMEDVFHHCFREREHEKVFYDMIPEANAVWIFGLPREQSEAIESVFGEVYYASLIAPLARHAFQRPAKSERFMQVYVRQGWIDLVVLQGNKLLLANSYAITAPTDAAYYVLGAAKRLQVNQGEDTCLLLGKAELAAPVAKELKPFLPYLIQESTPTARLLHYLH